MAAEGVKMRAMIMDKVVCLKECQQPLRAADLAVPVPSGSEILIKVAACGVCHTELDEIEGRIAPAFLPMVLGHQVVGSVVEAGPDVKGLQEGQLVGVAWIYSACGDCDFCRSGLENLCPDFKATGCHAHGGYAEYMKVEAAFAHRIPEPFTPVQAAPLLCAGAIGYRSLSLCRFENGKRLGLTGFGASAHLVLKLARHLYPDSPVYVFARNPAEQDFARQLGAVWSGHTKDRAPELLDSIIDTTPAWGPVVEALANLKPGGRLVINAVRKEGGDKSCLLDLDWTGHLWLEKEIKSVANVTSSDVRRFLEVAAKIPILPEVQTYALEEANQALLELKRRKIRGAKVLVMDS